MQFVFHKKLDIKEAGTGYPVAKFRFRPSVGGSEIFAGALPELRISAQH
jgi:hypothetical protein